MKTLAAIIALCALAFGTLACGDDDDAPTASPTATAAPTDAPTPSRAPTRTPNVSGTPSAVDCSANLAGPASSSDLTWEAILLEDPPAPPGWTIEDAEGDAPLVSVLNNGTPVGTMELFQFAHDGTFDPQQGFDALDKFVQDFYDSIEADREATGGVWSEDEPGPTPFGSFCGIKYGFTVEDQTGAVIERSTRTSST